MTMRTPKAPQDEFPLAGPRDALDKEGPAFAFHSLELLRLYWTGVHTEWRRLGEVLNELEAYRVYERWPPDSPYGSLNELCLAELGVPLDHVRQRIADTSTGRGVVAATVTTEEVVPHGPGERTDLPNLGRSTQRKRALASGISRASQQKLDFIARKDRKLRERVQRGELSIDRAYRQCRGLPPRTSVPVTVDGLAEFIRQRLSSEQIREVVGLLLRGLA